MSNLKRELAKHSVSCERGSITELTESMINEISGAMNEEEDLGKGWVNSFAKWCLRF